MDKVTETAPERIWLQISDDHLNCDDPFPKNYEDITWCDGPTLDCEVEYVRTDGFEKWWDEIGSGIAPIHGEDQEEHARRVAEAAWWRHK